MTIMKKQTKKRGFTLVELLATITVLSVVMIIVLPSVTKIIKNFGNNYYKIVEGNIKLAGIDYFTGHKTEIPKYVNESSEISLENLVTKGYLEEYPKNKNKEEITKGYVLAYKTGKGKYEYQTCITTDDYDEEKNSGYKTDKEYCGDIYTLEQNEILVPPSNGVYALPQKMPEDFDKIISIYNATKQTKESNSIRNISNTEDTVAPVQAIVSCEKSCNIKGTYTTDNVKDIIKNYFSDVKTQTEYETKKEEFLNKKIKIKYKYQYNGKTAEALFSFVEANEGEAPGDIKVVLNKPTEIENGGQVYGSEKDGVWKPIAIPENTELINWYNQTLVATVSPINTNEKRIKKYYCKSKGNQSNFFECSDESLNNSIQRISYSETNDIIEIYGVNKYGTATNTVTYSIKTDTSEPTLTVRVKKKNNGDILDGTSDISSLADYSNDTWFNGYTFVKVTSKNSGPSGTTVTCTDSRPDKDSFGSFRNVDSEGTTTISCRATSGAGLNSTEVTKTIKLDRTAPSVPTSKVDDNSSTGGTYGWTNQTITWGDFSSSDSGSRIQKYEYKNASGNIGTLSSSYNYPLNNAKTMNWKFQIRAVDNAGNTSDWSSEYTFKIDKIAPEIPSSKVNNKISYGGTYGWTNQSITWDNFASEAYSGINRYEVRNAYDDNDTPSTLNPPYTYPLGNRWWNSSYQIRAVSNSGNKSDWSDEYIFRIDQIPPSITIDDGPKFSTCSNVKSIYTKYTVTDNESGIKTVKDFYGDTDSIPTSTSGYWRDRSSRFTSGVNEFTYEHNWGKNCSSKGNPGEGLHYRLKYMIEDVAGNVVINYTSATTSAF